MATDDDAPLYVPQEFEAAFLDDARRTVQRTGPKRRPNPGVAAVRRRLEGPLDAPQRPLRALALLFHIAAAILALVFAAVTGTWAVGLVVVGVVAASLIVILVLLTMGSRTTRTSDPHSHHRT